MMDMGVFELMPDLVFRSTGGILCIEAHNVNHGLRMLLLFRFRNAAGLQYPLPVLGKALCQVSRRTRAAASVFHC